MAATYAALIALILLALGFALYVYHYERQLDIFRDTPPSFNVLVSLFDIAKTSLYFQIFGQIAAVLALILIIQGAMNVQHRGTSLLTFTHVTLVNTRRLLILALALICTGGAILIYLYELEPDLGEEMARVVSRLLIYLPRAAWIFVTLGLLLIANGLRRRA